MQSLRMALTVAGPRLTPRSVVAGACDPVSSVRSGAAAIVGGLTWDSASREAARLGARQYAWDSQPRLGLSLTRRQPGSAHDSLAWDSASRRQPGSASPGTQPRKEAARLRAKKRGRSTCRRLAVDSNPGTALVPPP